MDYLARMSTSRQFQYFGIQPIWRPGEGDIDGFCHDEVVRQFHDTRVESDGGVRVRYMRMAWDYALVQSGQGPAALGASSREARAPEMDDILKIGAYIEPSVNSTVGFRTMMVYIGGDTGAPPRLLNQMMSILAQQAQKVRPEQGLIGITGPRAIRILWANLRESDASMEDHHKVMMTKFAALIAQAETADDWYVAFEAVHPFGDGNGRSGKTLHNWLLGTLSEPVLVADYFGGGNP